MYIVYIFIGTGVIALRLLKKWTLVYYMLTLICFYLINIGSEHRREILTFIM